ncbi:MAG TPA: hypothetical protein PKW49_12105 [Paludibacteraceae bacterium]|jgi:Zn-dependent metalloprotease|nr:hypothetical protein [Paludibacteraceae bacterium]HQF51041.1 hypothetical protein [Paludibacteraceae bacterium]HQJ90177.1 hypothetical protein [Paludibacteraceae bacterium]
MKQFIYLLSSLFIITLASCSTPADYAEDIMEKASDMEKQTVKITEALSKKDIEAAEKALAECQKNSEETLKELQAMEPYDEKDELRKSVIEFVDFYNNIYKNEYRQAFDIVNKGNYTKEDVDSITTILMSVSSEEEFVKDDLISSFKKFCKEYELIISSRD